MRCKYDNWQRVTDNLMLQRGDGFWETTLSVPPAGTTLNISID
ncbi:carbohydrate-binding protein [Coleofasciculus sp. H7-2]